MAESLGECPKCGNMTLERTKEEILWADEEPAVIWRLRCLKCGYESMEA